MVERLKAAIDKAWERRKHGSGDLTKDGAQNTEHDTPQETAFNIDLWTRLEEIEPNWRLFERERIVTRHKSNPVHIAFDNLRTRLLRALDDHNWNRIAITSPTKGCGKTMVSANLAFSLARQMDVRTMLLDMDLRAPFLARRLGIGTQFSIKDLLSGQIPPEDFLRRIGPNLALGLNRELVRDSAELVQSKLTAKILSDMLAVYQPHAVIYDLPPMLRGDDVIAFLPNVDAVLLVAAAGQTLPSEITECERIIADHSNFLGVLLNKSTEKAATSYTYEYT